VGQVWSKNREKGSKFNYQCIKW